MAVGDIMYATCSTCKAEGPRTTCKGDDKIDANNALYAAQEAGWVAAWTPGVDEDGKPIRCVRIYCLKCKDRQLILQAPG